MRAQEPESRAPGCRGIATRNKVRTGTPSKRCSGVDLAVGKCQGESTLKYSYAINSPTPYDFVHCSPGGGEILLAFADGKIENVADHQALGDVLRRQRTFATQIVILLVASYTSLQPSR